MDIDSKLKEDIEKIVGYKISSFEMEEDDVISLIEDLVSEYENLKEEYENLQKDLEDNYKPISVAEQYGVSDRDFI